MKSSNTIFIFFILIYKAQEFVRSLCYIDKFYRHRQNNWNFNTHLSWKQRTRKVVVVKFVIKHCEAVRSTINYREKHSRMLLIVTESDTTNWTAIRKIKKVVSPQIFYTIK